MLRQLSITALYQAASEAHDLENTFQDRSAFLYGTQDWIKPSRAVLLKILLVSDSPGRLVRAHLAGTCPLRFWWDLGLGCRTGVSNRLPGGAKATDPWHTAQHCHRSKGPASLMRQKVKSCEPEDGAEDRFMDQLLGLFQSTLYRPSLLCSNHPCAPSPLHSTWFKIKLFLFQRSIST